MKLLLHICCAPCTLYPLKTLTQSGWEVYCFFYNPNIHPYTEYKKRLTEVEKMVALKGIKIIYRDEYPLTEFLRGVVFREQERCIFCYHQRLKATAYVARRGRFAAFSSTLLYSKFQKHDIIKAIGNSLAKEIGVDFYYEDFRQGWSEGIAESKRLPLYRQQYCGCIYSEKERFYPQNKK